MRPLRDERDISARAMLALDAELVIPPEIEARLLDAAFADPTLVDPTAQAMQALDEELSIPNDIEERILAAVPAPLEPANDAAAARDADRPPASGIVAKRRLKLTFWLPLAAALAVGVGFVGRSLVTTPHEAASEPALDLDAERAAVEASAIDWNDGRPWGEKMAALEKLRKHINALSSREATLRIAPRYVDGVRRAFLDVGKAALEDALRTSSGDRLFEQRAVLKEYLLLDDARHLHADGAWEASHLATTFAEATVAKAMPHLSVDEMRTLLKPHIATWIFLVETELVAGPTLDKELVDRARHVLAGAETSSAYAFFVTSVESELQNPALPAARDNLAYPSITLDALLETKPAWRSIAHSKTKAAAGADYELTGAYTGKARRAILRSLDDATEASERDAWVVRDAAADARLRESIVQVRDEYDARYIERWIGFVRDFEIMKPGPKDVASTLRVLGSAESPLALLLRVVSENTQPAYGHAKKDPVAERFRSIDDFAAGPQAPLARYSTLLVTLADELDRGSGAADMSARFQATSQGARALLSPLDDGARELLSPILLAPLDPLATRATP